LTEKQPVVLSCQRAFEELAHQARLLMTDVDGTLTCADDSISPAVPDAVRSLENAGVTVGLVSGRSMPDLERLAGQLDISGPLIAENGAVARLRVGSGLTGPAYSREPALRAFERLKARFSGAIRGREDNAERLVDVVFFADGIAKAELAEELAEVQMVDSGYIMHLMPSGISKGAALERLLPQVPPGDIRPQDVAVFGDSATDLSLFQAFPNSVLIPNPRLTPELVREVRAAARYVADRPFGEGFAEVARRIAEVKKRL